MVVKQDYELGRPPKNPKKLLGGFASRILRGSNPRGEESCRTAGTFDTFNQHSASKGSSLPGVLLYDDRQPDAGMAASTSTKSSSERRKRRQLLRSNKKAFKDPEVRAEVTKLYNLINHVKSSKPTTASSVGLTPGRTRSSSTSRFDEMMEKYGDYLIDESGGRVLKNLRVIKCPLLDKSGHDHNLDKTPATAESSHGSPLLLDCFDLPGSRKKMTLVDKNSTYSEPPARSGTVATSFCGLFSNSDAEKVESNHTKRPVSTEGLASSPESETVRSTSEDASILAWLCISVGEAVYETFSNFESSHFNPKSQSNPPLDTTERDLVRNEVDEQEEKGDTPVNDLDFQECEIVVVEKVITRDETTIDERDQVACDQRETHEQTELLQARDPPLHKGRRSSLGHLFHFRKNKKRKDTKPVVSPTSCASEADARNEPLKQKGNESDVISVTECPPSWNDASDRTNVNVRNECEIGDNPGSILLRHNDEQKSKIGRSLSMNYNKAMLTSPHTDPSTQVGDKSSQPVQGSALLTSGNSTASQASSPINDNGRKNKGMLEQQIESLALANLLDESHADSADTQPVSNSGALTNESKQSFLLGYLLAQLTFQSESKKEERMSTHVRDDMLDGKVNQRKIPVPKEGTTLSEVIEVIQKHHSPKLARGYLAYILAEFARHAYAVDKEALRMGYVERLFQRPQSLTDECGASSNHDTVNGPVTRESRSETIEQNEVTRATSGVSGVRPLEPNSSDSPETRKHSAALGSMTLSSVHSTLSTKSKVIATSSIEFEEDLSPDKSDDKTVEEPEDDSIASKKDEPIQRRVSHFSYFGRSCACLGDVKHVDSEELDTIATAVENSIATLRDDDKNDERDDSISGSSQDQSEHDATEDSLVFSDIESWLDFLDGRVSSSSSEDDEEEENDAESSDPDCEDNDPDDRPRKLPFEISGSLPQSTFAI